MASLSCTFNLLSAPSISEIMDLLMKFRELKEKKPFGGARDQKKISENRKPGIINYLSAMFQF